MARKAKSPRGLGKFASMVLAAPLIAVILLYRMLITPLLGANCRHLPTCSDYAREALMRHGPLSGGWFTLKRISSWHLWAEPAFDPVPGLDENHRPEAGRQP